MCNTSIKIASLSAVRKNGHETPTRTVIVPISDYAPENSKGIPETENYRAFTYVS